MRPPWNRRPRAARRRWLLVATAAGSILVMALSTALHAFLAPTTNATANPHATAHPGGAGHPSRAGHVGAGPASGGGLVASEPAAARSPRPSRPADGSAGGNSAGGGSGPGIQTRNASQNIRSGLSRPNNLGELGR